MGFHFVQLGALKFYINDIHPILRYEDPNINIYSPAISNMCNFSYLEQLHIDTGIAQQNFPVISNHTRTNFGSLDKITIFISNFRLYL